nr:MAG TPA: hypothetical protein [Caudoviricetes sp.]
MTGCMIGRQIRLRLLDCIGRGKEEGSLKHGKN